MQEIFIIIKTDNTEINYSIKDFLPKKNDRKVIKNRGGDGETNDDFYEDGVNSLVK